MNMKRLSPGTWSPATRILVGLFFVLVVAVVFIGLDNVPGYLLGMAAFTCLALALSRRWRSIRRFVFLAIGTLAGTVVLAGIDMEIALPLAVRIGGDSALESVPWLVFHGIISYTIILGGPAGIGVGIIGAVILAANRAVVGIRRLRAAANGS